MRKFISRRKFVKLSLALSAVPMAGLSISPSNYSRSSKRFNYKKSIIIDNLASPGPFNVPGRTDNPLTNEMLTNSRRSGITSVNVTVSSGGGDKAFEKTVSSIAYWEKELLQHPDFLIKIRSLDDIYQAKKDKKLVFVLLGKEEAKVPVGPVHVSGNLGPGKLNLNSTSTAAKSFNVPPVRVWNPAEAYGYVIQYSGARPLDKVDRALLKGL